MQRSDWIIVIEPREGDAANRSDAAIFEGHVSALSLSAVSESAMAMEGQAVQCSVVFFAAGAHTKLHTHDGDQILVITEGTGHVGVPGGDHRVSAGSVVIIPAGTLHYHGAAAGESMAHLTTLYGGKTEISDQALSWPPIEGEK